MWINFYNTCKYNIIAENKSIPLFVVLDTKEKINEYFNLDFELYKIKFDLVIVIFFRTDKKEQLQNNNIEILIHYLFIVCDLLNNKQNEFLCVKEHISFLNNSIDAICIKVENFNHLNNYFCNYYDLSESDLLNSYIWKETFFFKKI